MKKLIRSILAPLVSLVIVMLGNGFFNTFASLRIAIDGYPTYIIGFLNASYYSGVMLGSIYIERLIKRIGHIRTFAIFASINALVIVIQSMIIGPMSWLLFRFLVGFFIVIESWLLLSAGVKTRGKVLSLYMLTLYLAQGSGQFILNIAPLKSFFPFAITIILSSLSVIPLSMMKRSGPMLHDTSITNVFHILRRVPLGVIGCFIAGMIMSSFYGLTPIFCQEIGLSVFQISQVMGLTILGGLVLQWPIGHLSDIFNRRKVYIFVCIILMALTLVLFMSHLLNFYILLSAMILFGGLSFTLYPLSITYTCDYFSEKSIVGITCALLIVYGTGCIIGPLVSPLFMELFGPGGLFLFISLLCVAFISVGTWRFLHAKPLTGEEQSDYLPLPRASSLAFYLDPRSDYSEEDEMEEEEDIFSLSEEYEEED